ncbi:MAG: VWA domain-containing protein [Cyanobacteria bacterium J083]|nr:MAG: VWA domain-containing protein [Cyanobacteria bacterium J083]
MKVGLKAVLSDHHIDAKQASSQRQLAIAIEAVSEIQDSQTDDLPLNLCLILDHSGSMRGRPLEIVKEAAINIVEKLTERDRLSIVAFDHRAKVLVPNQTVSNIDAIKTQINKLVADGGTAIDEGLKLGMKEVAAGKQNTVSQVFLLTDGENEHGDNQRCLKLAQLASEYSITLNTLGFGSHWNQDVLENIADYANGTLSYIEQPEQAITEFSRLFNRLQSVALTNSYLLIELMPKVRLAELKPIAQVAPETIELPLIEEGSQVAVRLGDLMKDTPRIVLSNLYISKLAPEEEIIANLQVRYDDPGLKAEVLLSEKFPVKIKVQSNYQPQTEPEVQKYVLALAKYRQTQIAEAKLQQGDSFGAATMLQTAAKTALQLGDNEAATVLQTSATRLQAGEQLSEEEKKKTRIVSKTILQAD